MIQWWGSPPACPPKDCKDPNTGDAVCCSADCQVIGRGAPQFELTQPGNPNGGLTLRFKDTPASKSDPFWCDFDPSTGAQYNRTTTMYLTCNQTQATPSITRVYQNATQDCQYFVDVAWREACPDGGVKCSPGQGIDTTSCKACPAGSFSDTDYVAFPCTPCGPGSSQPSTGSTSCQPCAAGAYMPHTGASACESCGDLNCPGGTKYPGPSVPGKPHLFVTSSASGGTNNVVIVGFSGSAHAGPSGAGFVVVNYTVQLFADDVLVGTTYVDPNARPGTDYAHTFDLGFAVTAANAWATVQAVNDHGSASATASSRSPAPSRPGGNVGAIVATVCCVVLGIAVIVLAVLLRRSKSRGGSGSIEASNRSRLLQSTGAGGDDALE